VVEDDLVNQKVAVFMLEKRGYAVDVVRHGLFAVEAATAHRYSAIFMDCHMPTFDGFQATTQIRQREGTLRRTPIIAMTADAGQAAREKCLSMGMDDYLSKPLGADELDAALRRWCPAGPDMPALDRETLDRLHEMSRPGSDLVAEVIAIFLHDAPERLAALRGSTDRGDASELARVAHALKGSAGQLGARRVQALSARLEEIGRARTMESAAGLVSELEKELESVRVAMTAELERGKP
jgi:two-component system, sensor histidine kinase and response regulator